ncbi:MAG TPA: 4-(cytidine 5'-diphospho)-2-C-methyl-D-erythritol kinase [Tepidisphaeraceae bacterium]|nr:4-(cytidine 5'-diphospho)-2-C-methyl-D-erythritol kinase [Tepidisphaeraceae bacterium]
MRLLAPAKINLHLRVGPPRADGFHPLLSWMATVGLFDTLVLEEAAAQADPVVLACDNPDLPCDERNLVMRIARAWQEQMGLAPTAPVWIDLRKQIPMGAGLGGGSSDGARALMGLNRLWRTARAANDLSAFAARFGSDLPFFFHGPSSVCQGRGEIVAPVARPKACWAVLVLPELSMPTPQVYRRFDQMGLGRQSDIEVPPPWDRWALLDSEELMPCLVNDLEQPAFDIAPALGSLRGRIEDKIGRPVRMSGSGSSLFTLFDHREQASEAAQRVGGDEREKVCVVEVAPRVDDDLNTELTDQ